MPSLTAVARASLVAGVKRLSEISEQRNNLMLGGCGVQGFAFEILNPLLP
jgi:hypothetical protein